MKTKEKVIIKTQPDKRVWTDEEVWEEVSSIVLSDITEH